MNDPGLILIYVVPFLVALTIYLLSRRKKFRRAASVRTESEEAGLTEPTSLHPKIDLALCCGAAACVQACPEKEVIGIIGGKAQLIDPTACIGHGACAAACPTQAISLVFGTERRGVELPLIASNFETDVPGLFIAGELGGMGLIRNAIEQGKQAIDGIAGDRHPRSHDMLDLLIVGAGPAGFSASLAALQKGLKFLTIEQDSFGGTVAHFPRGKLVMTQPAELPIYGKVKFSEVSKEKLLSFWTEVKHETGLQISYQEELKSLVQTPAGFEITTTKRSLKARKVLLAIGRRGTPRKLGIPGEELSKVVYKMVDPAQFTNQSVLVVGGGDSALEAAATLSEETNAKVTLAYRGSAFQRAKRKNRERVQTQMQNGSLDVLLNAKPIQIDGTHVLLQTEHGELPLANDAIIICAGGILPTGMLKSFGVNIVTKYGEA